jgi:hypothetical protein
MALHVWFFTRPAWPGARRLLIVTIAATVAVCLTAAVTHASQRHGAWPETARSMAHAVALRWSADVPATARVGAEPPGGCRRLDRLHVACPIGIVVLANDARGRRPWRCRATVLVSRTNGDLAARRTDTQCAAFPPPSAVPDPAAALGTALALNANGDIACLPATPARTTCVMRYRTPTAQHCLGAASVPTTRPARAIALGARCK